MSEMEITKQIIEEVELDWVCDCGQKNSDVICGSNLSEKLECEKCGKEYEILPITDSLRFEVNLW